MKDKPYWESAEIPFFVKGPGVRARVRAALVSHVDLMPTTAGVAGIPFSSLDVDGRSMLSNLGQGTFTGWRKRLLVTGSNAVGPEENPGGANDPSGEWWLLRNEHKAFILRESGYKELYWVKSDPHQLDSKAWTDDRLMVDHLTDTVEAMRVARGQERRRLEER
jgi:N-acetylglucosamine-6-sulfatase